MKLEVRISFGFVMPNAGNPERGVCLSSTTYLVPAKGASIGPRPNVKSRSINSNAAQETSKQIGKIRALTSSRGRVGIQWVLSADTPGRQIVNVSINALI